MLWQRCSDQACALQKRLYHRLLYCHKDLAKGMQPGRGHSGTPWA